MYPRNSGAHCLFLDARTVRNFLEKREAQNEPWCNVSAHRKGSSESFKFSLNRFDAIQPTYGVYNQRDPKYPKI
jgi:hypothetical protein